MPKEKITVYGADFETINDINDCRVWSWGISPVLDFDFTWGYSLEDFYNHCLTLGNCKIFFHNLGFDGEAMLYKIFEKGYKHVEKIENDYEFSTLIDSMGSWYSLELKHPNGSIKIYDSFKLIPYSLEKMAKTFGVETLKGEIDYNLKRPLHYCIELNELIYQEIDVRILCEALKFFIEKNLNKMTIGSNSLEDYKKTIGSKNFSRFFPVLEIEIDDWIRKSYKGGYTYLNEKYKNVIINGGIVYDFNSLYPSVMKDCYIPFGEPIYYKGKYEDDFIYNLYIQKISCSFEIKKNHIPTIQLKNTMSFIPTEYLKTSKDEIVELYLTSVDLKLFLDHYNVYDLEYIEGYMFKSSNKLFTEFIEKHAELKIEAEKNGNMGLRELEKLLMNNSYGKYGTRTRRQNKIPYLNENGQVKYTLSEETISKPVYTAAASFITAYARDKTIRSAQSVYHRFIYADTDSLHLIDFDEPDLEIDKYKLGFLKLEYKFLKGLFVQQKRYLEELHSDFYKYDENGNITNLYHVACASMPHKLHSQITFENFKKGSIFKGRLKKKKVKGGTVLIEEDFTLK